MKYSPKDSLYHDIKTFYLQICDIEVFSGSDNYLIDNAIAKLVYSGSGYVSVMYP
jgi:hypothetical protein